MTKDYLCKCNNCESIMFDENPDVGAKKKEIPLNTLNMEQCLDNDGSIFLGCPICGTDEYLTDL